MVEPIKRLPILPAERALEALGVTQIDGGA